jgi:hypothetical protein
MKNWMTILLALNLLCLAGATALADTGTYEIKTYRVKLEPREDGRVKISYYQKWEVHGGSIPWITVGTANSSYTIISDETGSNAASIQRDKYRNWTTVKIDLDRDYLPGETFEVSFALVQEELFYDAEGDYRLDFIPGWYDRAETQQLEVELEFFAELEGCFASGQPERLDGNRLLWSKSGLAKGEKLPISVVFPRDLFPGAIPLAAAPTKDKGGKSGKFNSSLIVVFIIMGMVVLFLIIFVIKGTRGSGPGGYGSGGQVGVGGVYPHAGGCVVSCACACVACACACACAGGGAAGCDRKLLRKRPDCDDCEIQDCPLRKRDECI